MSVRKLPGCSDGLPLLPKDRDAASHRHHGRMHGRRQYCPAATVVARPDGDLHRARPSPEVLHSFLSRGDSLERTRTTASPADVSLFDRRLAGRHLLQARPLHRDPEHHAWLLGDEATARRPGQPLADGGIHREGHRRARWRDRNSSRLRARPNNGFWVLVRCRRARILTSRTCPRPTPFCKHIHYLWAKGFISGCDATNYCPDGLVTRGAMAKFLTNAFGLQLYGPVGQRAEDPRSRIRCVTVTSHIALDYSF